MPRLSITHIPIPLFATLVLAGALPALLGAQTAPTPKLLTGQVRSQTSDTLAAATVLLYNEDYTRLLGTAMADENGNFALPAPPGYPVWLITRALAHIPDTTLLFGTEGLLTVELRSENQSEVEINATQRCIYLQRNEVQAVEVLTEHELTRAACCNLGESFETQASAEVNFSDPLTGAREIQLMGLNGAYVRQMTDKQEFTRGLGRPYALSYTPGPWVQSIAVMKGPASVVLGYEGLAGQINVQLREPRNTDRLFLNGYVNHLGRVEGNLITGGRVAQGVHSSLLLHSSNLAVQHDVNGDRFQDVPRYTQVSARNLWDFQGKTGWEGQIGVGGTWDRRLGGQLGSTWNQAQDTLNPYALNVEVGRLEVGSKTGWVNPKKPYQTVGIQFTNSAHWQNGRVGLRRYTARHQSSHVNVIYEGILGTTGHKYRTGVSFLLDRYRESLDTLRLDRTELVPGAFFEYTYTLQEKLTFVAGLRLDYHNLFGLFVTPRIHLKYTPRKGLALRWFGGRSYAVANILAENPAAIASGRQFVLHENLQAEDAVNTGIHYRHEFSWAEGSSRAGTAYLGGEVGFYWFFNQSVFDYDADVRKVLVYNLEGKSYGLAAQVEAGAEPVKGLSFRAAYKFYEVRTTLDNRLQIRPMIPLHRFFVTMEYGRKRWRADVTLQFYGSKRLPHTAHNPEAYRLPNWTPAYPILHAQFTLLFKNLEWYIGGENLTNFFLRNPLPAAAQPFSPYFDASMVWGPMQGTVAYTGFRWRLPQRGE